jgi:regulator of replication initiation timing
MHVTAWRTFDQQVAVTEADVRRAQQQLAAFQAEEHALEAEKAQAVEQQRALSQRQAELERRVHQQEAASLHSRQQKDDVRKLDDSDIRLTRHSAYRMFPLSLCLTCSSFNDNC